MGLIGGSKALYRFGGSGSRVWGFSGLKVWPFWGLWLGLKFRVK